MSQTITMHCDLCREEIQSPKTEKESALIELFRPGDVRAGHGKRIDLCGKCYKRFVTFLEKGG